MMSRKADCIARCSPKRQAQIEADFVAAQPALSDLVLLVSLELLIAGRVAVLLQDVGHDRPHLVRRHGTGVRCRHLFVRERVDICERLVAPTST